MEIAKIENTPADGEILIIEDSPTQAAQLQHILERHGFTVSAAANGREALNKMADKKPALVISDVIMPEMDGYELCRRIKSDGRYRDIPVILLTSLAESLDVIRGLECGADNFITKPYNEEYLLSRINNMLMERRQESAAAESDRLEIFFDCRKFNITADRRQILHLLLSTYEAAIQKNRELARARDELNELNAQLETANRELESFSYTVSHDLRSPLTNIHGYSQLLMTMHGDKFDEESLTYVRTIYDEAERMDQIIGTLLSFSRLIGSEINRTRVDLSQMAAVITAGLRMSRPERRVTFTIADGISCNGDARLLKVVMENLLGNAWKYTSKKEEAVIEFGKTEKDGKPAYFVRDNGAGFDMEQADKIFAPFQRLHDADEFKGFGIGLATVQRIIQRHGGWVWAEGEPGKGATFYFTLP
jgi:two-component system sensor histidine kinase/response regulator